MRTPTLAVRHATLRLSATQASAFHFSQTSAHTRGRRERYASTSDSPCLHILRHGSSSEQLEHTSPRLNAAISSSSPEDGNACYNLLEARRARRQLAARAVFRSPCQRSRHHNSVAASITRQVAGASNLQRRASRHHTLPAAIPIALGETPIALTLAHRRLLTKTILALLHLRPLGTLVMNPHFAEQGRM